MQCNGGACARVMVSFCVSVCYHTSCYIPRSYVARCHQASRGDFNKLIGWIFLKLLCSIVVAIFADIDEFLMYNRFSAIVVCRSSNTSYNSTDTCSSARTHSYDNLLIVHLNWTVNSGHNVCLSIYLINLFTYNYMICITVILCISRETGILL